jgi:cold shock CspA family protein
MPQGNILWFNQVKDLGVIATETGDRLDVQGTGFAEGERPVQRCAGAAVMFRIVDDDGTPTAADVSFVPDIAPRRARMRHARFRSG